MNLLVRVTNSAHAKLLSFSWEFCALVDLALDQWARCYSSNGYKGVPLLSIAQEIMPRVLSVKEVCVPLA